jgi:putative ABC transport system ATP-binding protein
VALLRRLADKVRQTVILVTHDAAVAAVADEVIMLRDGLIADRLPLVGAGDRHQRRRQVLSFLETTVPAGHP